MRLPPRSTLFPTRRSSDLPEDVAEHVLVGLVNVRICRLRIEFDAVGLRPPASNRSEEHTSELQSQSNLVCRLLLEKKKHKSKILRRHSVTTYHLTPRSHTH